MTEANATEEASRDSGIAPALLAELSLSASPSSAYVGDEITFFANASSDVPGATLTFTIYYDYLIKPYPTVNPKSAFTVNTTSNPGIVVTKHSYNTVGNYTAGALYFFWVYLFVDDGSENVSQPLMVRVNYNQPPVLISPLPDPFYANSGEEQNISILIEDQDYDTVTIFWDFGDGTNATNVTVAPPYPPGSYVNVTHVWEPVLPGRGDFYLQYWLNVTMSDGINPPVNCSTIVNVYVPIDFPPTISVRGSESITYPLDQVNFTANASDPGGDPLSWTFDYGDGSPIEVFHSNATAPGALVWQNTTHIFSSVGSYTVNVSVSDAPVPYQTGYHNVTLGWLVNVILNSPPHATVLISLSEQPLIKGTIGFDDVEASIGAVDQDGDALAVAWMLDGILIGSNSSAGGEVIVYTFTQPIRFNDTGLHNVSVAITDGRPGHEIVRWRIVNVGYALSLSVGWNLISLPFNSTYTADTLGLMTGDEVVNWNSTSQTYDKIFIKGVSPPAMNFALAESTAYWVYATTAKVLTLYGNVSTAQQSRAITVPASGGWALVGLCTMRTDLKASDLAAMYYGGQVRTIAKYTPPGIFYEPFYTIYIVGMPMNNFSVFGGQGYWIFVDHSGTFTYNPLGP